MRNTRTSGQILLPRRRPQTTSRSGWGKRTNSSTALQSPVWGIELDAALMTEIHSGCRQFLSVKVSGVPPPRPCRKRELLLTSLVSAGAPDRNNDPHAVHESDQGTEKPQQGG